ncbi:hypothetical protein L204_102386 [Cryptococcus depauperatus]
MPQVSEMSGRSETSARVWFLFTTTPTCIDGSRRYYLQVEYTAEGTRLSGCAGYTFGDNVTKEANDLAKND